MFTNRYGLASIVRLAKRSTRIFAPPADFEKDQILSKENGLRTLSKAQKHMALRYIQMQCTISLRPMCPIMLQACSATRIWMAMVPLGTCTTMIY